MANRPKITIQKGVQQTAKGWSKEQAKEPDTVSDQLQRKNATYWDPREKKKISRKRQSKRDRKLIIIASLIMLATCAGLLFWNNWSKDWSKDNTLTTSPDTDIDSPVTPRLPRSQIHQPTRKRTRRNPHPKALQKLESTPPQSRR